MIPKLAKKESTEYPPVEVKKPEMVKKPVAVQVKQEKCQPPRMPVAERRVEKEMAPKGKSGIAANAKSSITRRRFG
jgi:hypothetical protein